MTKLNAHALLKELVAIPGPPGQEDAVRDAVIRHVADLGCAHEVDARGNLLVSAPGIAAVPARPDIAVLAHLDEIALIVTHVDYDGWLRVRNMGGLYPWKWGEGPVTILAPSGPLSGILSFGSIHTDSHESPAVRARTEALTWAHTRAFTGLSYRELEQLGVRPGVRVCLGESRRAVSEVGDFLAAPFLDDRADLVAMLLALEAMAGAGGRYANVVFAATVAEEVGGHGALYLLRRLQPAVGIALEIGPRVPETPFAIDEQPCIWVSDGYSAMRPADIALAAEAAASANLIPHWQSLSRGGSDASCADSQGLLARLFTLAFAAENSHGCEIMHRDAPRNLALLLNALLERLSGG